MGGCKKFCCFLAVSFVFWGRVLATLLLFLYVTDEAGRKYVRDKPWLLAAECNMITNKQTDSSRCPGLGYTFPVISLLMGKIYLDGAKYRDRSGIISIRVGIRG
jgi:hypothetical protein